MSEKLLGTGEVYDGEFYLADVSFGIRGEEGWIRVRDHRAVFPLHHELVENGKTLTLYCPERTFSFSYGGKEKQKVIAGDFLCTWSILVKQDNRNSGLTSGRYPHPLSSQQNGDKRSHQHRR